MSELVKLRAAWESERVELERRQWALAAIGVSIAAGRYEEAQAMLDREAHETKLHQQQQQQHQQAMHHFTVTSSSIEAILVASVVPDVAPSAPKKKKERRSEKPRKRAPQRVDSEDSSGAKLKATGRPRSEKEGFEWHSSVNKHTKYRCLRCADIIGVRMLAKHACG